MLLTFVTYFKQVRHAHAISILQLDVRHTFPKFSRSHYNRVIVIAHRNVPVSRAKEHYTISNRMLLILILITFEKLNTYTLNSYTTATQRIRSFELHK